jgi:transcriptional regulator with XRE-family HTH domain
MSQTIAANIRAKRELRGLTQSSLAKRMGLKTHSSVGHWESGRTPDAGTLKKIAVALDCEPSDIDPLGEAFTVAKRKPRGPGKSPAVPVRPHKGPDSASEEVRQRAKLHGVDKSVEVGDNPYSQTPTTMTEGLMKDQIDAVVHALGLIDADKRPAFVTKVKRLAANIVLGIDVEDAGPAPAKQKRAVGKG